MLDDKNSFQNDLNQTNSDIYAKQTITQVLKTVNLPASRLELIEHFGNEEIQYKGCLIKLKEIITQCRYYEDKFYSKSYLVLIMCNFLEESYFIENNK